MRIFGQDDNATRSILSRYVTTVARVITKHTAMDMPAAVLNLLDTPRKGQIPRNCASRILFTNIADMNIIANSAIVFYFEVSFLKSTIR